MSAYWPKSLMSKSPITVALFTTDPKFYVKWGAKTIFTNVFQLNFTNKWGSSIDKKNLWAPEIYLWRFLLIEIIEANKIIRLM